MNIEKTKFAAIRKSKNITQLQLAEAIGVRQKDISRWESGKVTPQVQTLKNIADKLNVTIEELLED